MTPIREIRKQYDIVVAGGGVSGMCAAIAAARNGAKVALIQNRSMVGGNASSEIRMHIVGANCRNSKPDMIETGILMEILLENKHRNPYHVFPVWDTIMWEKVRFQDGLDLYLNTCLETAEAENGVIKSVQCFQNTTETRFTFDAKIFVDCTGHGTLGVLAGAASRTGTEAKCEFNEPHAPAEPNDSTMGNTILFQAENRGEPVEFIKPEWAYRFSEDDLKYRTHIDTVYSLGEDGEHTDFAGEGENDKNLPEFFDMDSGYWWIELGGQYDDIIGQAEEIRDELLKCVYGVWDHIKNVFDHGAKNYDLKWVGMVPGYRESRRLEGDYILTENDIFANRVFEDAVAYGGWPIDEHVRGGIMDFDKLPSRIYNVEGCYTIPYRSYYSKNIENLFMAGRDISCSKLAFASTRVMATCAVGGQAAGTAAALAVKYGETPREIGKRMDELQQTLLRQDCYIPGFKNTDAADLARGAKISCSSEMPGCEAVNVINGIARKVDDAENVWESAPLSEGDAWIRLDLDAPKAIRQVRLTFDPNLCREIMPTITSYGFNRQCKGMPDELVKDYILTLKKGDDTVFEKKVEGNYQRLNVIDLPEAVEADSLTVTVSATHDHPAARIFEIRMY